MFRRAIATGLVVSFLCCVGAMAQEKTYAERLGWPKGTKALIIHSDDLGMCYEGIVGTEKAMEHGIVTSCSTMMPCPWVPGWAKYLKAHPNVDNGLHLTLTSEWDDYRWGPVAGKPAVPSLVDKEGCLWDNVALVNQHATADDVEREIRAQIDRAQTMGLTITHLDSHMGTLFSNPEYFKRYVKVGIEKHIPILIIGNHGYLSHKYEPEVVKLGKLGLAQKVWDAGLPVLDDATGQSYDWKTFPEKKKMVMQVLRNLHPGVTELIVHCTDAGEHFKHISSSGELRKADMKVMMDPDVKALVKKEGIVLTTWRELQQRRDKVGAGS